MRPDAGPGGGPRLIAGETSHAHATLWRVLHRQGISQAPRQPREQPRRYEWPCPGDLLHIDSKRFSRFTRPGHAVTGIRDRSSAEKRTRVGHELVHSLVNDHSRLAYSELHPDERAHTVVGFVEQALAFFDDHGITTKRLMSDNAWDIHPQPCPGPTASPTGHPLPHHPLLPPAGQRQGRALATNTQTRMGTRPDLPLKRPPSPSPATPAPPLQPPQTPQPPRRTPTNQPRPQRPEARQLEPAEPRLGTLERLNIALILSLCVASSLWQSPSASSFSCSVCSS